MSEHASRRRFLRSAGVAVALPVLEAVAPRVRAEEPERRPVRRLVCVSNNYGVYPAAFFPREAGAQYALPETLEPLAPRRDRFTVFSHLDHGISGGHACVPTWLSGVHPHLASHYPEGNVSLDQKAAEHVGARTRFPSLTLQVNDANLVSWTRTGVQVPGMDLRQMYRALFLEDSAAEKAARAERSWRHRSILDAVREQAGSLQKELGRRDQRKLEEYLEAVRGLERKIVQEEPWIQRPKPRTERAEPRPGRGTEADLQAMVELIALAIQTDSSRVFTLTSGFVSGDFGFRGGYHGISHHGERDYEVRAKKAIERNQIAAIARLMDLLAAEEDPVNGGTLLDHTIILYGCGMATGHHSTKDLPFLLAGGGFRHGEHKVYPEEVGRRVPAANLLLSVLQAFGLEADRFGTSTGALRGLDRV